MNSSSRHDFALMDASRLARTRAELEEFVDRGELAGIVTLVSRAGEIVAHEALGWRDIEASAPMQPDTMFRIASMTKPITSVAALMLVEQGRLDLDEPITRWVPELANRRVLASGAPLWLLDEPANGLDQSALGLLERAIAAHRATGGAVLVASHTPIALPDARSIGLGG